MRKTKNGSCCFWRVWLFRTLFFAKRLFTKQEKQKSILLINYNNLGDLVCDTPSLRNIRREYSSHKIVMLVRNSSCVDFMSNCPYIDEIVEIPHKSESAKNYYSFARQFVKYNFEFSMQFVRPFNDYYRTFIPYMMCISDRYGLIQQGREKMYKKAFNHKIFLDNTTTRTEESLELVKLLNIKIDNDRTECWINEKNVSEMQFQKYIIVQTCATLKCRMWHKNRFSRLIELIHEKYPNLDILLTGTKEEESYIKELINPVKATKKIHVLCNLNIDTLLSYIKNAKVLITNDTGPFHFARAFDTPIISIFGISPPSYLIEETTPRLIVFQGSSTCQENCDIQKEEENCKAIYKQNTSSINCINNVSVQEVFDAFCKLLTQV